MTPSRLLPDSCIGVNAIADIWRLSGLLVIFNSPKLTTRKTCVPMKKHVQDHYVICNKFTADAFYENESTASPYRGMQVYMGFVFMWI